MLSASTALETPSTTPPATTVLSMGAPDSPDAGDSPDAVDSPDTEVATQAVVERHLRRSSYASLRSIDCQVSAGTARLSGQLPSYFLKQTAQEIVRRIAGVEQIHNHLEVIDH